MGRPHRDRLLHSLAEVRKELAEEVAKLKPEEFDNSPNPALEMKTCKGLLQEIGTMEKLSMGWLIEQKMASWESAVAWSGDSAESTMRDLEAIRADTIAYLNGCTEDKLETPVPLPEEWYQYFPDTVIEPEELVRWVVQHEYYHLGQLITYRWIWGDNPYAPKTAPA